MALFSRAVLRLAAATSSSTTTTAAATATAVCCHSATLIPNAGYTDVQRNANHAAVGGDHGRFFRSTPLARMSSSSSDVIDMSAAAEAAGATEAEKRKIGSLQGALLTAKAELDKKAAQTTKIDWSQLDQKSEHTKVLKNYFDTFKPPAVDKTCVEDVKQKFAALQKVLKEDAATALKEIDKIDEELKKLDFELVRIREKKMLPPLMHVFCVLVCIVWTMIASRRMLSSVILLLCYYFEGVLLLSLLLEVVGETSLPLKLENESIQ